MGTYVGKITVAGKMLPVGSSLYGLCESGAGDEIKYVELEGFDTLIDGITVHICFKNSNTAKNPKLDVNGTGAKDIFKFGDERPGTNEETSWVSGSVLSLTYTGAGWYINDWQNAIYYPSDKDPLDISDKADTGTSERYSREDHVHAIDVSTGDNEGEVKIAGQNVKVNGLKDLAFKESLSKEDVGLGNVDNKSSETIRSEITKENVTDALGYIPVNEVVTKSADGLVPKLPNEVAVDKFLRQDGTWAIPKDDDTKYEPASKTPLMDGEAKVGSSIKYAREDHVHPTDTSRVPITRKVNGKSLDKDVSLKASDVGAIDLNAIGSAGGVAPLNDDGLVDSSFLPSYVDDVIEKASLEEFPTTGESGKIYVALDSNLTYRWSGSNYVEISKSLALGTTSSTAFRGDYGLEAYSHATDPTKIDRSVTVGLYKVGATLEGHISDLTPVEKEDITALGIPGDHLKLEFEGGTNSFYVTQEGGEREQIRVTPSIQNNITGKGVSGHIAEFKGQNVIGEGPAFGTDEKLFLRNDGVWAAPEESGKYDVVSKSADGLVPQLPDESSVEKFFRQDGKWAVPPDTRYSVVTKSSMGLVPQLPNETATNKYLRQDGTWAVPPDTDTNTTYDVVSKSAPGLVPQLPNESSTKKFLRQDGIWATPPESSGGGGGTVSLNVETDMVGSASLGTDTVASHIDSWDAGTKPTLSKVEVSGKTVNTWSAGSMTTMSIDDGTLEITLGEAPTLTTTNLGATKITNWDAGTLPTLTSSNRTVQTVFVERKNVVTNVEVE